MELEKVNEIGSDIEKLCKALSWTGRMISCMPTTFPNKAKAARSSAYWDIVVDEDEEKGRALMINYSVKRRPKFWIEEIDDSGDIANTVDLFSNWDKSKFEMEFSRIIRK